MSNWGSWVALIGGIASVIGQFAGTNWLPAVGGIVAIIGALGTFAMD